MSFVLGGQWRGNKGTGTAQDVVRIAYAGSLCHVEITITRLAMMSLAARMPGWLRALALIANHDSAALLTVIHQEIHLSIWFGGSSETKTRYDILS